MCMDDAGPRREDLQFLHVVTPHHSFMFEISSKHREDITTGNLLVIDLPRDGHRRRRRERGIKITLGPGRLPN
jgi:hypothetical protein